MTRTRLRWILGALMVVALAANLIALGLHPGLHPDEFFQYLEPAWRHWQGYGWKAWEWDAKLRSWIPPGYYGAWMVMLSWVGVRSGATMHLFFQIHWAVLSVAYVWFGWRAGCAMGVGQSEADRSAAVPTDTPFDNAAADGWRSGLLAAAFCATLPWLAYYAPHTLVEVPASLMMVWGFTIWIETRNGHDTSTKKVFLAGSLLCFGAMLRIQWAPLALVPAIDWLVRKRFKSFWALVLGTIPVFALFAIVDWLTWGFPFESTWAFIDYNLIRGKATDHGISEHSWYLTTIVQRFGPGIIVAVVLLVYGLRRVYLWLIPALAVVAYLSTQRHQEERFIFIFWPMIAIAMGTCLGLFVGKYGRNRSWVWPVAIALGLVVIGFNARGISGRERLDFDDLHGLRACQAWAAAQHDISGMLIESRFHLTGGYLLVSKNIPLNSYNARFARNRIFNYYVLRSTSSAVTEAQQNGFKQVWEADRFVVLHRQP